MSAAAAFLVLFFAHHASGGFVAMPMPTMDACVREQSKVIAMNATSGTTIIQARCVDSRL